MHSEQGTSMSKLTLDELIERLSELKAQDEDDEVLVNADEMAEYLGHQRVTEVFQFAATMVTNMHPRRSKRSLIPPDKQFKRERLVNIKRLELINELTATRDKINRTVNQLSS